jgi:hypothetical protein
MVRAHQLKKNRLEFRFDRTSLSAIVERLFGKSEWLYGLRAGR